MEMIGKGQFTTAYRKNANTVLLKSTDPIKECMSLGWFPNSHLFPKVTRLSYGEVSTYEMVYYPKVKSLKTALKPKHYEYYTALRKLYEENRMHTRSVHNLYNKWYRVFSSTTTLPRHIKQHLLDALDACSNYGSDIAFEISPRNVAVSKTGGLILLDCFLDASKL